MKSKGFASKIRWIKTNSRIRASQETKPINQIRNYFGGVEEDREAALVKEHDDRVGSERGWARRNIRAEDGALVVCSPA